MATLSGQDLRVFAFYPLGASPEEPVEPITFETKMAWWWPAAEVLVDAVLAVGVLFHLLDLQQMAQAKAWPVVRALRVRDNKSRGWAKVRLID